VRAKVAVVVLAVALVGYLLLLGQRGVLLVRTGNPVAVGLGVGVLVLPLLGAWALVRELRFGVRTEAMGRRLAAEGALPPDDLPRRPSGRVERAAADAAFPAARAQVEERPQDWRAWFRLGLAYDAAGDRRRARAALRHAADLHDAERAGRLPS
jgi:cytochrome c-type biogenesis protein CcmH/NrfG